MLSKLKHFSTPKLVTCLRVSGCISKLLPTVQQSVNGIPLNFRKNCTSNKNAVRPLDPRLIAIHPECGVNPAIASSFQSFQWVTLYAGSAIHLPAYGWSRQRLTIEHLRINGGIKWALHLKIPCAPLVVPCHHMKLCGRSASTLL